MCLLMLAWALIMKKKTGQLQDTKLAPKKLCRKPYTKVIRIVQGNIFQAHLWIPVAIKPKYKA